MGCFSSKILSRSGSLREKANQGFQGSGLIGEIIRSSSKGSGHQLLDLLRTSSFAASARWSKPDADDEESPVAAKIETINVSELLAGLEEEGEDEDEEQERQGDRMEAEKTSVSPRWRLSDGATAGTARSFRTLEEFDAIVSRCSSPEHTEPTKELAPPVLPPLQSSSSEQTASSPAPGQGNRWCVSDAAAGSARSFRTLEEFDAMVSRCSSPEHAGPAAALAPEPDASVLPPLPPRQSSSSEQDAVATASSAPGQGELVGGAKRRARARQLSELSTPAPAVFDFRRSGSLRDWLLGGGQIFSPGSYVTPKFGKVPSDSEEHGERRAVFDPELVAQLEGGMEELTADEERVLREVLEVLEAGEKETKWPEMLHDRAASRGVAVQD